MIIDAFTITGMVISVVTLAVLFSIPLWADKTDHNHVDSDTLL